MTGERDHQKAKRHQREVSHAGLPLLGVEARSFPPQDKNERRGSERTQEMQL